MAKRKEIVDEAYENPYVAQQAATAERNMGIPRTLEKGRRRRLGYKHAERRRHGQRRPWRRLARDRRVGLSRLQRLSQCLTHTPDETMGDEFAMVRDRRRQSSQQTRSRR